MERDEIHLDPDELKEIRHTLHRNPELGFEETRTADYIAGLLEAWGYEVHRGLAKTGLVGTLRKGTSKRSIGLRADMDALPVTETAEHPYASE